MANDAIFLAGSLCVDDIINALKNGHSAFSKSAKNGKTYMAIKQWVNDEEDQYGRHSSVSLNSDKSAPQEERAKNIYIGNLKKMKTGGNVVTQEEASQMAAQFEGAAQEVKAVGTPNAAAPAGQPAQQAQVVNGPVDDLPF